MKTDSAFQSIEMPEGVLYASNQMPGFTRTKRGKSFVYRQANGQQMSDSKHIARIQKRAIPPASTAVLICPNPQVLMPTHYCPVKPIFLSLTLPRFHVHHKVVSV